jgi:hypothetical protein
MAPVVYWHRQLPPMQAEPLDEHTIEADSVRVPGTIAHRDELWDACEHGLTSEAVQRLQQEVDRLGGSCAHVLDERIEVRHDAASDEAWLHGRFTYMLYR